MTNLLKALFFPSLFTVACSACGGLPQFFSSDEDGAQKTQTGDPSATSADPALISGIKPTRYAVELTLDPAKTTYQGQIDIELDVALPSARIVLHAQALKITAITVESDAGRETPAITQHQSSITLKLARQLPAGKARVRANFEGQLDENPAGLFHRKQGDADYLLTAFQDGQARRAFPCFDEPTFVVPFALKLHVPQDLPAIHNTAAAKRTTAQKTDTVEFQAVTLPLSRIAFAVGPFDFRKADEKPIRIATSWGKASLSRYALKAASQLVDSYQKAFGTDLPQNRVTLLAQPADLPSSGGPGLQGLPETLLLCDADRASFKRLRWIWQALSRALARLWFEGRIYPADPADRWLFEGAVQYAALKALSETEPSFESPHHAAIARQSTAERAHSTASKVAATLASLDLLAEKAGRPQAIQKAFQMLLQTKGAKSAREIYAALDEAVGFQTEAFFAELPNSTRPIVAFRCQDGQVQAERQNDSSVPVPVCVRSLDDGEIRCEILNATPQSFSLPSCAYAPNANAIGDYEWVLPAAEFLALQTDARLTATERAAMTANLEQLLFADQLDAKGFFQTLDQMATSEDPVVVKQVIALLGNLHPLAASHDLATPFAERVRQMLEPQWTRMEESDEPDIEGLTVRLQAALAHLASQEESVEAAQDMRERFLNAPMWADLEQAAMLLPESAQNETQDGHNELIRRLAQTTNILERTGILSIMGGDRDESRLADTLDFILDGHIAPHEIPILLSAASSPEGSRALWQYYKAHRIKLHDALQKDAVQLPLWGQGLCSQEELEEFEEQFADRDPESALSRNREQVKRQIERCLERQKRLFPAFKDWLAQKRPSSEP